MSLSLRNLAIMLVLAIGAVWWVLRDDPEAEVRTAHAQLADLLRKAGDEAGGTAIFNARALRNLFAQSVAVSGDARGIAGVYSPEELAGTIVRLRGLFTTIELESSEVSVEFPASDVAIGEFSATLTAAGELTEIAEVAETRTVTSTMRDVDGRWLFTEFLLNESDEG